MNNEKTSQRRTFGMRLDGKYLIAALSLVLLFGGMYFKFLYDVPDGEEFTNALVSWLLVVFGIVGIMVSALWKTRNPLEMKNGNKSDKENRKRIAHSHKDEPGDRSA